MAPIRILTGGCLTVLLGCGGAGPSGSGGPPAAAVSVAVSPSSASVLAGQSQAFLAQVTGTANTAVTWNVVESGGGNITMSGLYTAPGTPGTYHVNAVSLADPTKSGQAVVSVTTPPAISVSISPAATSLLAGQTQSFKATVTGTGNTAVTWSVLEAGGGGISRDGLYTAPGTAGIYHVEAASVADPTKSAQATATVASGTLAILAFSANPPAISVGQSSTLSWSVSGATNLSIDHGVGTVAGSSLIVTPAATTTYTLTATNASASVMATATVTVNPVLPPPPSSLQIFPSSIGIAGQKATSADPKIQAQWQAFLTRLDENLNVVVPNEGIYQGSELEAIPNYALAYRILRATDKARAEKYADKAIGLIRSALHDYQKGTWIGQQFLARGDGHTLTFQIPNTDLDVSTFTVYLGAISTTPVTKGASGGQDDTGAYYSVMLKASRTADGNPDYLANVDWRHNGDYGEPVIDWSLNSANQPSTGQTYFLTSASAISGPGFLTFNPNNPADTSQDVTVNAANHTFTLQVGSGHRLTAAPDASLGIFVQYSYGTHASDYSTLAYQQTSMGDGGFNSAFVDTGYASRYLGKNVAIGYDWLYDYPGFSTSLKTQVVTMLGKWFNYFRNHGYNYLSPASNYGAGEYISALMTMAALQGRASFTITDGSAANMFDGVAVIDPNTQAPLTAKADVLAYRDQYILPLLTGALSTSQGLASYKGGFWAEGWSYGQMAAEGILAGGRVLEESGLISSATEERAWAAEAITMLLHGQSDPGSLYDGGDWYAYPAPFVGKDLMGMLTFMTSEAATKTYGNHVLQNYSGNPFPGYAFLFFNDPNAAAADWTGTFPLQYKADGTGLVTARADWSYHSTWLAFQLGNLVGADHQSGSPGVLQVSRGADQLLFNGNSPNEQQYPKSFSNTVMIDDNGDGYQEFRFDMGFNYHAGSFGFDASNPPSLTSKGCFIQDYEPAADHLYVAGDYRGAFFTPQYGRVGDNSATELTRQVVYVRPDYVFVHDRAGTRVANYPKILRWHFPNLPTVSAPSSANPDGSSAVWNSQVAYGEISGSSRIFGVTYGTAQGTPGTLPLRVPAADLYGQIAVQGLGENDACPFPSCSDVSFVESKTPTASTLVVQGGSGNVPVYALLIDNDFTASSAPTNVRYSSTFQTAPSGVAAMDPYAQVSSVEGAMEGSRLGSWLVLFGKDGYVTGNFSYSAGPSPGPLNHLLVDLVPGANYSITVSAGGGAQTRSASQAGVLEFITSPPAGAAQTITVTKN